MIQILLLACAASPLPLELARAGPTAQAEAHAEETASGIRSLPHAELAEALHALGAAHPELCELLTVGHSREGRAIEALRIGAGEGLGQRPAILLVAGLEGPQAWTSGLALHHAGALVRGHGERDDIDALLASTTIYVIPRANPDACEARHAAPLRVQRGSGHGIDNDRDGLIGEDDVGDVDGDGIVAWIRHEHPEGTWVEDPADARVLIEARRARGERGRYRLMREGRDDDQDGEVGEDPPLDAEVNRNFPHAFEEHTARAGLLPTHEPETRALCDFLIERPDIALVLAYGELMNLAKDPKTAAESGGGRGGRGGRGRLPAREVLEGDGEWLGELGRRYRELTGNEAQGSTDDAGTFQAWTYHHRGLPTLAVLPFEIPLKQEKSRRGAPATEDPEEGTDEEAGADAEQDPDEEGEPETPEAEADRPGTEVRRALEALGYVAEDEEDSAGAEGKAAQASGEDDKPSDDARRLAWLEAHGVTDAHLRWTPFEHPELGPVEVGGLRPYVLLEPPAALADELAAKHLDFLVSLGELLPRVELVELSARELAPGLVEVSGHLENASFLPLQTRAALRSRSVRPARIDLVLPEGAELLAGTPFVLVEDLVAAGGRHELRWLVRGAAPGDLRVTLDTDHAGNQTVTPEVSR